MNAPDAVSWQGKDVGTNDIIGKIGSLWKEATQRGEFKSAVRTSIFNLVVYSHSEDEAKQILQNLRGCTARHPSRTIVLVPQRLSAGSSIDASVSLHFVSGPVALCYEEVLITARGRVADHLGSVIVPLLVPQLPTYLWWPGQPPFGHRMFHRLLERADQLVVDSAQFAMPGDGLANLARLVKGHQGVNDFNWSRLNPWKEVIAQFFDGPTWWPYAHGIRSMTLEFGEGAEDLRRATAGTLLLLGWIASQLEWEPETTLDGMAHDGAALTVLQGDRLVDIGLHFRDHGHSLAGRLTRVEMVSQPKNLPPARFAVERLEDHNHAHITMTIHEGPEIRRVVPLDLKTDEQLLTDELELAGHDTQYDTVVEMASRLAGREVWIPT